MTDPEVKPEQKNMQIRKALYILQSEMGKAIKETRDKKTAGYDVPRDVLKLLGEDGLRLMTLRATTYMKLDSRPKTSLKL
jgi:hypothetical protein